MNTKSATQKLDVRWQDRRWRPAISRPELSADMVILRRVATQSAHSCSAPVEMRQFRIVHDGLDAALPRASVVRRFILALKPPFNN